MFYLEDGECLSNRCPVTDARRESALSEGYRYKRVGTLPRTEYTSLDILVSGQAGQGLVGRSVLGLR